MVKEKEMRYFFSTTSQIIQAFTGKLKCFSRLQWILLICETKLLCRAVPSMKPATIIFLTSTSNSDLGLCNLFRLFKALQLSRNEIPKNNP